MSDEDHKTTKKIVKENNHTALSLWDSKNQYDADQEAHDPTIDGAGQEPMIDRGAWLL